MSPVEHQFKVREIVPITLPLPHHTKNKTMKGKKTGCLISIKKKKSRLNVECDGSTDCVKDFLKLLIYLQTKYEKQVGTSITFCYSERYEQFTFQTDFLGIEIACCSAV